MPAPLEQPVIPEPIKEQVSGPAATLPENTMYQEAARDTIRGRVDLEITAQYRYPPAVPEVTSITSTTRQLTDGGTVADITVNFEPDRELLYDFQIRVAGENPQTFSDIKESPLQVYSQATNKAFEIFVRAKHPVSGFASEFSPVNNHTSPKDLTAPAVPPNFQGTLSQQDGTVMLRWNPVSEADLKEYIIYRDSVEYSRSQVNFFDDPNLTPGEQHSYEVSSIDQSGNESAKAGPITLDSVAFFGTIPTAPEKTAIIDPPASFGTAYSQAIKIPTGTKRIKGRVMVRSNVLVAPPDTITLRVRVVKTGSITSNEVSFTFGGGEAGVEKSGEITFASDFGSSIWGDGTIFYEWKNTTASTYQLTTPGGWEASLA